MRNLLPAPDLSNPTVDDQHTDASVDPITWADVFTDEMAQLETDLDTQRNDDADADRQLAEMMAADSSRCRECGAVSAGCVIAGSHIQACDACIIHYVLTHIVVA